MKDEESQSMTEQGQSNAELYMTYTFGCLLAAGVGNSTVQRIRELSEELGVQPAEIVVSWLDEMAVLHEK